MPNNYDYLGVNSKSEIPPDYEIYQIRNPSSQFPKFTNSNHSKPILFIIRKLRSPLPPDYTLEKEKEEEKASKKEETFGNNIFSFSSNSFKY